MASRVNKKFVAILAVALVVVGGAAMYAGYVALRKSGADYIRKGDAAMTEGDYKRASVYYGIAYNHDRTRADWLDKWVAALEAWTPATRTEYSTQFSQLYMPVIKQVAHTKRTDLAAHDRYLGMVLDQIQRSSLLARGGRPPDQRDGGEPHLLRVRAGGRHLVVAPAPVPRPGHLDDHLAGRDAAARRARGGDRRPAGGSPGRPDRLDGGAGSRPDP